MSPYRLIFIEVCYLSMELEYRAMWTIKQLNFNLYIAGEHRKLQLNELEAVKNDAYENVWIYKDMTKVFHNKAIL